LPDKFKYRAFLSYSHHDKKWADWIHGELERFHVPSHLRRLKDDGRAPPKHLKPVFRDSEDLSGSPNLPDVIHSALDDSEAMIVICSPAAVASRWVNIEIQTFQRLGRGHRIFALIVDGLPFAGDSSECLPNALRHPVDKNNDPVPDPPEPLAADLRTGKRAQEHAKIMLIAGLLDVPLDELVQRDLRRRMRALLIATSVSMAITISMAGLMVYAFVVKKESEQRREVAENLIGFMLGDLRDDLHAIGRIDLYGTVTEKAMEYFRTLDANDAQDEILAQRSEALRQLGESHLDQGDIKGAEDAFSEALEISKRLAINNPSRLDWNLALAESHFWVGFLHWQRGELKQASQEFAQQLSIVDALALAEPDNPERLSQSGYAWTNYGRVLELTGKYQQALQAYQKVETIFNNLLTMQPNDTDTRLEVGFAQNNIGKLELVLGRLLQAELHFKADLDIKQTMAIEFPDHNFRRKYLADSHYWYGMGLLATGKITAARKTNLAALKILDDLLGIEPSTTSWRDRRANVHLQLAIICRTLKDLNCATDSVNQSQQDISRLLEINSENVGWRRTQTAIWLESAWQNALHGNTSQALDLAEKSLTEASALTALAPEDHETRKIEIQAQLAVGEFKQVAGLHLTEFWQSLLDALQAYFKDSQDPEILDIQARLLVHLGQLQDARKLQESLQNMNYQSTYAWQYPIPD
jgi:tetratricopeptide (TPR) repeat protein